MAKRDSWIKENIVYFVFLLLPLVPLAFLCIFTGKNLFLSVPTWSDELDYFREVYSFSRNGLSFGGSLFVSYGAPIGPFGAHSFSPVVVYGLFSLLFGFNIHSIFIINIVLLSLSMFLCGILVKPKGRELFITVLCFTLFPPMVLYIFTSMIEIPLYAGIIFYYGLYRKYEEDRKPWLFVLLMLTGTLIVLSRMTYIVILFPAILSLTGYKFNKKTVRNLCIYLVAFLILYKVYNLFCAVYPDWVTEDIKNAPGLVAKLKVVFQNTKENLYRFFLPLGRSYTEVVLRYFYGFITLFTGIFSFIKVNSNGVQRTFSAKSFAFFVMAGGLFAMMVTLYDIKDWRDYRTFGPIALFLLLMLLNDTDFKDCGVGLRYAVFALSAVLLLVSRVTLLTEDRNIQKETKLVAGFESIKEEDDTGKPLILATSYDLNWGDANLMASIPSKLGFQTFYNGEVNETTLGCADYVLLTEKFVNENEDITDSLVYITNIDGYGKLYSVIK